MKGKNKLARGPLAKASSLLPAIAAVHTYMYQARRVPPPPRAAGSRLHDARPFSEITTSIQIQGGQTTDSIALTKAAADASPCGL